MAREQIEAFMVEHKVTVNAVFVPWSKSRSYDRAKTVSQRNLNWRVTVARNGREILTTDYSAGIAHAPSYKQGQRITLDVEAALKFETEQGHAAKLPMLSSAVQFRGKPILPDPCDVLYSLAMDASVLDARSFEDWASELGYDADSRTAEGIYRACLDIALKLRNGLADSGLRALQTATEDY